MKRLLASALMFTSLTAFAHEPVYNHNRSRFCKSTR